MLIGWMRIVFLYSLILVCIKYLAQFRIIVLARKGVRIGKRSRGTSPKGRKRRWGALPGPSSIVAYFSCQYKVPDGS